MKVLLPAALTLGLAAVGATQGIPQAIISELADARAVANYMRRIEHFEPSLYTDVSVYKHTLQLDGGYHAKLIYSDEKPDGTGREDRLTVMIDGDGILPPLTQLDLRFDDEGLDGIRYLSIMDEVTGLDGTTRPVDLTNAETARRADRIYADALRLIARALKQ